MDSIIGSPAHLVDLPASRLPVLVLGLPGVPGLNAFHYLRSLFPGQVFGLLPTHESGSAARHPRGPDCLEADGEDRLRMRGLFDAYRFGSIIDASGWCALKSCELDPALGRRLNVDIGRIVMEEARRVGARLLRLSTDLVFDGNPRELAGRSVLGSYREACAINPVTMYGKLMAEAEAVVLEGYPEAAVLRIALPMGPSLNGHAGAIDWIESRFRKGRPATLYFDEVRSSLYVQDLNRVLLRFLASDWRGIIHAGGPRPLSLFNIAQVINRVGDYDPELLMGCPRAHAGPMPPRAGNVAMDSGRLTQLLGTGCMHPWPHRDEDAPDGPDWHRDRSTRYAAGAIADILYGMGGLAAWDHPLRLIPFLQD